MAEKINTKPFLKKLAGASMSDAERKKIKK